MSKEKINKNSSSIRKKIVYGYMRMYCFISFILLLIFIVASYIAAFYATQEYLINDIAKVLNKIVEYKNVGLGTEELYTEASKIMPSYVQRYDLIAQTKKVKEEDYYNSNYYNNVQSENKYNQGFEIFISIKETPQTLMATPTTMPAASASEAELADSNYNLEYLKKGYVTSTNLYIRQSPDINSGIIYQAIYGNEIYIIEDLGEWYKVLYEGKELYAVSKLITIGAQPTATPPANDEYWQSETNHLFSKNGTEYTTEKSFDYNQTGNAITSLKEPYLIHIITGFPTYKEIEGKDYVEEEYYSIKAVVDITNLIPYYNIWAMIVLISVGISILFILGLILIWVYGAAKTKKYLKPIDEITRLAREIQPNSQYRLDVNTAKYELKELVITTNNMLDRLNAAHVKRKKFVSDVSHELRTPISVIAGYANMLKRWAKDDQAVFDESVDAIIEESANMKYLVENLLFLARSDNDQNVYEMESFDISSLIESICKDAKIVDKDKHEIICDIEQGIIINGDRNRLRQALREFMQNAIKYTPPMGEIKMSLQKMDGKAIINVKDTGMGISKKDMGHIFTRFYRGDVSRNRDKGGYGLGLAICREIISAHKGTITLKSKEDAGTIITVSLNLA